MDTPTTEPFLASERHDVVLALALGSLSAARRFEKLLGRVGTPPFAAPARDDRLLLAALGAVSLGRTLQRWLEEAAQQAQPSMPSSFSPDVPGPHGLLR